MRHYVVLLVLLGLAVHLLLPQIAPLEHSLHLLRSMPTWLVLLAVAAQALSYLGSGYLTCATVGLFGERLGLRRGLVIALAASSVGEVAGGTVSSGAATFGWVRAAGASTEAATLASWLPSLFNTTIQLVFGLIGLTYLVLLHRLAPVVLGTLAGTAALLGIIVLGGAWAALRPKRLHRVATTIARAVAWLRRRRYNAQATERALGRLDEAGRLLRAGGWTRPALGSLMNVGFDLLTIALLFPAAGYPVSPGVLFAGYGVPAMLGKLTLLPGGLGIVEGSMAALYEAVAVPAATTVVVVLLYRVLSFWLPLLLGLGAAAYLQQRK
jgi:uncharacterized protein (TIRG00374 family)